MSVLDDNIKNQLKGVLGKLRDDVKIIYFTQELECGTCKDAHDFLDDVNGLSEKLSLEVFDFEKDKDRADSFDVDKVPAIVFLDKDGNNTGVKYYGIPAGYEINSFVQGLLEVSGSKELLPDEIMGRINAISQDVHIQVFVSLT